MTQDDVDEGRLILLVGIAPVNPAEFVIFRISQLTTIPSVGGSGSERLQLEDIDNHYGLVYAIEEQPGDDVELHLATIRRIENGDPPLAERVQAWPLTGEAVVGTLDTPPTSPDQRSGRQIAEVIREHYRVVHGKRPREIAEPLDRPGGRVHFLTEDLRVAFELRHSSAALREIPDRGEKSYRH